MGEEAYNAIKDRIIRMRIAPGQALNTKALAKELGIGMAPLRDALQRLEKEHLVVILPRKGTYATPMTLVELQTAFDARTLVERAIWRMAATRVTEKQLQTLQAWFADMRLLANKRDFGSFIELDSRFHREVARISGNVYLEGFLSSVMPTTQRIWYYVHSGSERPEQSILEGADGHRPLIEALGKRSVDLAEESITQHISNLRCKCLSLLDRPGVSVAM